MKSRAPSGVLLMSVGVSTSTKPLRVVDLADGLDHPAAEHQPALHRLAPDVEVAVLEAQDLVDRGVGLVDVEGRRLRLGQDLERRSPGARSRRSAASGSRSRAGAARPSPRPTRRTRAGPGWPSRGRPGASALSMTTWVIPWRSRRSRKISWPWSRRRWTQPARRAVVARVGRRAAGRRCGCDRAWRGWGSRVTWPGMVEPGRSREVRRCCPDCRVHTTLPTADVDRLRAGTRASSGSRRWPFGPMPCSTRRRRGASSRSRAARSLSSGSHTQMAFTVDDVEAEVADLTARGVVFEAYEAPRTDRRDRHASGRAARAVVQGSRREPARGPAVRRSGLTDRPAIASGQAPTSAAIASRCAGVLPQQPPMIDAPASRIATAAAAIVAGSDSVDGAHVDELGHPRVGLGDEDRVGIGGAHPLDDRDRARRVRCRSCRRPRRRPTRSSDATACSGRDAHHRVAAGVERHRRDERDAGRHAADALDGGLDLGQVGHRLDPDEVDAAGHQRGRLLGEDVDRLVVVERPGRAPGSRRSGRCRPPRGRRRRPPRPRCAAGSRRSG